MSIQATFSTGNIECRVVRYGEPTGPPAYLFPDASTDVAARVSEYRQSDLARVAVHSAGTTADRLRYASEMIRAFEPEDEDELIRVWLASTIPGQSFLPEEHWRAMEPEIREDLLPIAETWVVEECGELVAFMSLLDNLIGGLFTHPDHQGKGNGRALIEHARGRRDPVLVEVFEANEKAVGFYRMCGFVDNERRVDEGSGLSQLILRLEERMYRA